DRDRVDAGRLFIVDEHCATWREVLDGLAPVLSQWLPLPGISGTEARQRVAAGNRVRFSPWGTLRHLASAQVRGGMRGDPLYAAVEGWAARAARRWLPGVRGRKSKRRKLSTPPPSMPNGRPEYDVLFLARQLRGVRHSGSRARERLGYVPEISFEDS